MVNLKPLQKTQNIKGESISKKIGIKVALMLNIGMNFLEYPKIKLFGVLIILQSFCHLQWVGFFGIKDRI